MGQVVAHPALAMEKSSLDQFLRYAEQFGITPVARARIAAAAAVAGASMRDELAQELDDVLELDLD